MVIWKTLSQTDAEAVVYSRYVEHREYEDKIAVMRMMVADDPGRVATVKR